MKALIVVAAAALAFPVYAQQKSDTKTDTTLPNAQERQHNRDTVANEADKAKEALPDANERARARLCSPIASGPSPAIRSRLARAAGAENQGIETSSRCASDASSGAP